MTNKPISFYKKEIIRLKSEIAQERSYTRTISFEDGKRQGIAETQKKYQRSEEIELLRSRQQFLSVLGQTLQAQAELLKAGSIILEPRQI